VQCIKILVYIKELLIRPDKEKPANRNRLISQRSVEPEIKQYGSTFIPENIHAKKQSVL